MITTAILAALLPAAVAAVVLAPAFRVWRRDAPTGRALWALPVALFAGFVVGYVVLRSWPPLPPIEANQWLFWVLAAVAALAAVDALVRLPAPVRWAVRLAVSVAVPWLLFQQMLQHTWTGTDGALWVGGLGLGLFVLWSGLEGLAARAPGPSLPLTLVLVAAVAAGALLTSGNALLGQLAGTLAAGLGAVFLLSLLRRDLTLARSAIPVVAVGLAGLVAIGTIYGELRPLAAVLLLAAPLLPWAALLGPLRRLGTWPAVAVRAGLATLALAAALWLALTPPTADETGGGDDSGYEYDYDYSNLPE